MFIYKILEKKIRERDSRLKGNAERSWTGVDVVSDADPWGLVLPNSSAEWHWTNVSMIPSKKSAPQRFSVRLAPSILF